MRRLIFLSVAVAMMAACSTKPKPDAQTTESPAEQVAPPTAEQLATTPCANPDWRRLPPGSEQPAAQPE